MGTNCLPFITCAFLFFSHISYSQENNSIDQKGISGPVKPVKNKISAFISGGAVSASGNMKDSSFIDNGWNVEGGVYIPFFSGQNRTKRKSGSLIYRQQAEDHNGTNLVWSPRSNIRNSFTAGVEADINYAHQKSDGGQSLYANAFLLSDGNGGTNPLFENKDRYKFYANSFQIFAGPKAEWNFGKIAVSPSVMLGYVSMSRKGYTLTNTIVNPKQTTESKTIPFITATDYTASGFVVKPKVELGYHFTTQFSVFAAGAMAFGPSIQNNFSFWKPQSGGAAGNVYSYDQFAAGAARATTFNSRWQTTSINLGLRYTWIKNTFDNGHGGRKQRAAMAGQPGAENNQPNEMAAGDPHDAVRGWDPQKAKPVIGKVDSTAKVSSMPSRLSMTPTTTRQTQNRDSGEKVNGGLQSAGNLQSVVKADSTTKMPSRLSMTPTTTRQTQGASFGEKVSAGMQKGENPLYENGGHSGENPMYTGSALARPGQPIKGVIVKGGKNPPGGLLITAVSGDNGEVLLNNLEPGNYQFTLTTPDSTKKNPLYDQGGSSANNPLYGSSAKAAGGPLKGCDVKLGRVPPVTNFTILTVSYDGQISFDVLEAGNYKLIIETPGTNTPPTKKAKKKKVEKATSGIKDTLKSQV